jgi:hypothetical protein
MANFFRRPPFNNRLLPIHIGILTTFALIPAWYRFKPAPGSFDAHYATGFLIFWPMLWTIVWWLLLRLPGFKELRRDRIRCAWALLLLLLVCWAFLSWSWAYTRTFRPEVTVGAALPFAMAALFAIVVACVAPPLKRIISVIIITMVVSGLIAGWQVAQQGQANLGFLGEFKMNPANSGVSVVQADGVRWLRPYGLLPHPNMLAGHLTIGLLCAVTWIIADRHRTRWIGIAIFMFGLWILLLTFSRSAWGAFAGGAFALLPLIWGHLRLRQRRWTFVSAAGLVILLGLAFFILYRPFLAARAGEGNESIELRSVSDRAVFNEFAFDAIDASPILGVGMGNFPWIASEYLRHTDFDLRGMPVHQIFLYAWSELGLIGFSLTILTLLLGVESALQAIRRDSSAAKPDTTSDAVRRAVLLCAVIVLMLIGLLDHYPWTLLHFQVAWLGLLAAAGSSANQNAASQVESGA